MLIPNRFGAVWGSGSWSLLSVVTPWKINMEPKNHPIEQEHHLPSFSGSMLIFQGVVVIVFMVVFFTPSVCLEDKSKWCFCWLAPGKLTETLTS